jgi:hypothetical protein
MRGAPTNLVTATRWRPAIGSRGVGQWHTSVGLCSPLWLREHGLRARKQRGAAERLGRRRGGRRDGVERRERRGMAMWESSTAVGRARACDRLLWPVRDGEWNAGGVVAAPHVATGALWATLRGSQVPPPSRISFWSNSIETSCFVRFGEEIRNRGVL